MKNFILTFIGVATLLIALTLNFRHALDDYGVTKNKLHMEVLAQTNDTGGGGTSGGDSSGGDSSGGSSSGGSSSNNSKIVWTFAGTTTIKKDGTGSAYIEFSGTKKFLNDNTLSGTVKISVPSCSPTLDFSTCDISIGFKWTF